MMLKDLFPTLAHGHQHGLFFEVIFDVAKHSSEGKAVKAGNLPRQVAGIVPPDYTEPEEVLEDVEIIMRSYG